MKTLIGHDIGNYVFNAAAGTITFSGLPPFALEQILLITDVNLNIIIYNFANPATNGGTLVGNVLTLDYNTSALSSTDPLQIYMDLPTTAPSDTANAFDAVTHELLKSIAQSCAALNSVDAQKRLRVTVDNQPTVTTTVTTITNMAAWAETCPIQWQIKDWARQAYNSGIRSNLTFGN